ncbi:MAG: response regulator [Candidatus Spechtbacterales bacterium]
MNNKILIIEDDPFLSDIYITKFEEMGYDVGISNDGEEGLKKVREYKPDIVLLDIVLPKKNGLAVLEEIKKDGELKNIPVLILSNLGMDHNFDKAKELGAAGYLVKSQYTPSEVVAEVEKILKARPTN